MLRDDKSHIEKTQNEIKQLYWEIAKHIAVLDENIKSPSIFTRQEQIDIWRDKKTVLEVAFMLFSGEKNLADLKIVKVRCPHYNDGWSFFNVGWICETASLVDAVTSIMSIYDKQFVSSCVKDNSALFHNDIILLLQIYYLDTLIDVVNLAKISKNFYSLFKNNSSKIMFPKLLNLAVLGKWNAAKEIWSRNPEFLTLEGTVSGHYLYKNLTVFQIAWMNEEDNTIADMSTQLKFNEQIKQFNKIFQNGEIKKNNWDFEKAKLLLGEVYSAVIKDNLIDENNLDSMEPDTRIALQTLYDFLNPETFNKCQMGLVFDVRIYLEALKCYDTNFNAFGSSKRRWERRSFWCVRVEEAIARYLPTGYLGLYFQDNNTSFQRCPKMSKSHFFIDGYPTHGHRVCTNAAFQLEDIHSTKNKKLKELYSKYFISLRINS